jgi:SRSO17 transposase
MDARTIKKVEKDLTGFVEHFGSVLGRQERRHWCKIYLMGLLLDGERKSVEPMANKLAGGNVQSLQQFVNQSPWDHKEMSLALQEYMDKKIANKSKGVLVLDDTTLPKKGNKSVGVGRQYCGALGKVCNCQSIVSWHWVTEKAHYPVEGRLYLPSSWTEDAERMDRAGVPVEYRAFKKKWEIALDQLEELKKRYKYEALVMDAGYGEIKEFLSELNENGDCYVAQLPESHSFWPLDVHLKTGEEPKGRKRQYEMVWPKNQKAIQAKKWNELLSSNNKNWRNYFLKQKSRQLKVKVAAVRVRTVITQNYYRPGPEAWLIIEKLPSGLTKYYVSNAKSNTPIRKIIQWAHQRWKVEQGYQQLKEELGLDHFEGRSWIGLHHHWVLCVMAFYFLTLLRYGNKKNTSGHYLKFVDG